MSSAQIEALAEQFGASAALIERSAAARAAALGSSPEAVLAGWTGGETPAPAPQPAPPPETSVPEPVPPAQAEPEAEPEPEPAEQEPQAEVTTDERAPALAGPTQAPSEPDQVPAGSLSLLLLASIALVAAMFVATVIAPITGDEALSLDAVDPIVLSASAESGRELYLAEGCAECHTQQVRPVVADADLGTVTLDASPLVPGLRRIGPDLSHSGSREPTDDGTWLIDYLLDPGTQLPGSDHPSYSYLSANELEDLAAYLVESK